MTQSRNYIEQEDNSPTITNNKITYMKKLLWHHHKY